MAGPRETAALIETVDRFVKEFADADNRSTLLTLRAHLAMRLDLLMAEDGALEAAGRTCIEGCEDGARAIAAWSLPRGAKGGAHLLAKGARKGWTRPRPRAKRRRDAPVRRTTSTLCARP
jgi:hypothetical protein